VAVLAVGFAALAALAWLNLLQAAVTPLQRCWLAGWTLLATATMVGLPLLRPWARALAVLGLGWLTLMLLATAAGLVGRGRPAAGILLTLAAGGVLLVIRYLRRPSVKAWFERVRGDG
jgi:hypothetical protein